MQADLRHRTAGAIRHHTRPEVVAAWTWPARHGSAGSITGLAAHVHLSSRQLGTLFQPYVVTDRLDELYDRVRAAGATIVRELDTTDYGSREFAVADPEDNLWSFGTYPGKPRREPR